MADSIETGAPIHGPLTLEQLAQLQRQFVDARNWRRYHTPRNLATALIVEAAELLEHFQWADRDQAITVDSELRPKLCDEVADVFIYLLSLSDALGMDLATEVQRKLRINEARWPIDSADNTEWQERERP
jgi:NTP pyrophosphatase (non-canonical NTP hydrolase)